MFKHRGDKSQTSSRIFTLSNLNKILLILTVMDDFFSVDVSQILSRSDNRRLERLKSQAKLSAQSLHTSSSGQLLRPPSKKEEIQLFFDALFGSLGKTLNQTVDNIENKTHLTDFVYAKVRKLALWWRIFFFKSIKYFPD